MQVIKRITASYRSIMSAKIYFFFRKSLWLYLLGMFLIASVSPLYSLNIIASGVIYFLLFLIVIVIPAYHFSTIRLDKLLNFDADVEFNELEIILRHRNNDVVETKDRSWIKQIGFTNSALLLTVNQINRFVIFLDKSSLTADELAFFTQIKSIKGL